MKNDFSTFPVDERIAKLADRVIVVIGDIVASRKIKERVSFDQVLLNNLAELNAQNLRILSLFIITGEDIPHLNLLQQTFSLISHNLSKWNRTRLQILWMLQKNLSVKEIAAKLHISDKAVYKTVDVGALKVIIQLFGNTTPAG